MRFIIVLMLIMSFGAICADSLLDPQVISNTASSPSSQFKRAKRQRPTYDYRLHDTIMVNVNINDTIQFTKQQDYRRDKTWANEFRTFVDNFGGAAKQSLPAIELQAQNQVRTNGQKRDGSRVRLDVPCEIIEILPHGDLLIEGSRNISSDESVAEIRVGGRVNPKYINQLTDIILSESILNLRVKTDFDGPLADNQKRGFISKLLSEFKIF